MRRRLAILGIGLLGTLALGGLPAEGKLPDAGVFKGSYHYTHSDDSPPYAYYRFSKIGFQGAISSGQKTYTGYFYIAAGLVQRAVYDDGGGFTCFHCLPDLRMPYMEAINYVAVRGAENGQALEGRCGGPETHGWSFACTISVNGSARRPVVISGTTSGFQSEDGGLPLGFDVGVYG